MNKTEIAKEIISKTVGEKSIYSVEDVQRLLNKSRQEIYNLIYEGVLKPVEKTDGRKPRKYTFTFISLLEAYIKLTEEE